MTSSLGHRTGKNSSTLLRVIESMSLRYSGFVDAVGCSGVGGKRNSFPMELVKAMISIP